MLFLLLPQFIPESNIERINKISPSCCNYTKNKSCGFLWLTMYIMLIIIIIVIMRHSLTIIESVYFTMCC